MTKLKNEILIMTSKAQSLITMKNLGLNVPYFKVVDCPILFEEFLDWKSQSNFTEFVSVRSAGSVSTPGRMQTKLNVRFSYASLSNAINSIFDSAKLPRVTEYLKSINYDPTDFKVQCIIQNQIPVRSFTSDFSAVVHVKLNAEEYPMEWASCQGNDLMSGAINPSATLIDSSHDLFHKIKLLSLYYQSDIEVEITYYNGNYYFLQCRPTVLGTSKQVKEDLTEPIYARYILNLDNGIAGLLTRDINYPYPEKALFLTDDTTFDELEKLLKFKAILTTRGGMMCHAAAICRIHNKPAILSIVGHETLKEGFCIITTDGYLKNL